MGRKLEDGKRVTKKIKEKEKKKKFGNKSSKHIRIKNNINNQLKKYRNLL
tara:strand:+ start:1866 stop:2015 length:150 start_codon:yes stop_codon:yes gene_type:complete